MNFAIDAFQSLVFKTKPFNHVWFSEMSQFYLAFGMEQVWNYASIIGLGSGKPEGTYFTLQLDSSHLTMKALTYHL